MRVILLLCTLFFSLSAAAKPVNINTADAKTISASLSGIGEKKAEAIVNYRNEHGPFKTLKDLIKVKGIGEKTVQKNEQDILFTGEQQVPAKKM